MTRLLQITALIAAVIATIYFAVAYFLPKVYAIASTLILVLLPFIMAIIMAMLMEPIIRLLSVKLKLTRGQAVSLSMLTVFSSLGLIIVFVFFRLTEELVKLSMTFPYYVTLVSTFIETYFQKGKLFFFSLPPGVISQVNDNIDTITSNVADIVSGLAGSLVSIAASLPGIVLGVIVAVIATFFFSRDRGIIIGFIGEVIPKPWGDRFIDVSREVAKAFISYIRAQSFLITLTTIQAIIGLYVIGAQYALTVGFLVGLLDVIPVLGPAAIFIPWAIWSFIMGNTGFGVKLVILYLFIWIVRQSLEARVVAGNLGLHPLSVLVVMYIGLKLMGVPGLILGPVLLIAGKAIFNVFRQEKI